MSILSSQSPASVPRIVAVGNASLDVTFGLDELLTQPGKHFATRHALSGGGVASNGIVAARRLGAHAAFIGRVGDDHFGQLIVSQLAVHGIDTQAIDVRTGVSSPVATVLVAADGERQIVNYTDPQLFDTADDMRLDALDQAHCLLADLRWPAGLRAALEGARYRDIPSLVDFDLSPDAGRAAALELATHIVFSLPALTRLTGEHHPRAGLQAMRGKTSAFLGVTAGEAGAFWVNGGTIEHQKAFAVDAVDTTGAGDVFHGALAVAIAEGKPVHEAMRFAAAAAALKCQAHGVRDAMPDRAAVEAFLHASRC